MKQTAVEWLEEKLIDAGLQFTKGEALEIEQAKEMEKQQMFGYVEHSYITRTKELEIHKYLFEQYYNEKFNK
jgi:hypothetical protein